ncbi:hypothetical protein G9A89_010003 [Geosiphon pyriformis]|nr:hypothetical protein G9A89_010003 [Geosiphon pyriformis]
MTIIRTKSKKAAPDICFKISNKISTKRAFSVVEATRQNILEAFPLSSNHDKLSLVTTEAISLSLAGFSLVKVPLKRHTWISFSVAFNPTKSPKVFNNRPVNKLVFLSIDSAPNQLLASAIVTPNPFVVPNEILDEIFIVLSDTSSKMGQNQPLAVLPNVVSSGRSSPVLETKQSLSVGSSVLGNWADQMETELSSPLMASTLMFGATFKIKLAHIKAVFQSVHGFLGAKSVLKDNMKLFCVEFVSQVFLEAVFLIELTSSVHLVTLKIAKSLVVSEFGSSFAAVVLYDVLLGMSAANIKTALSVFGSVTYVVLKSTGIWQYVVVYFEKLDSVVSALNYWSVLNPPSGESNETILSRDKFKAKLFALVTFGSQTDLDSAVVKTELSHLAADCKVSLLSSFKSFKVFTSRFISFVSYTKASASLSSFGFLSLSPLVSSSVVVGNPMPVGSLVKLFEQFINGDLVSNSKLGLKINEVMVHMGSFSKVVSKLGKEVVSLKKKCCIEDINMSGDSKHPVGLDDKVFSNLMSLWEHESVDVKSDGLKTAEWLIGLVSCSVILFSVVQKMSALDKFSSRAST